MTRILGLVVLIACGFGLAKQYSYPIDGKGKVTFVAVGQPRALKISGVGGSPTGELTFGKNSKGTCSFELATLDTGIGLRNTHMKEKYLEIAKYPSAKLVFTALNVPPDFEKADFSSKSIPFKGTLSLHGVDRPIEGNMDLQRAAEKLKSTSTFEIKLSEYKIDIPSFAGLTVADKVTVNVDIDAPLTERP